MSASGSNLRITYIEETVWGEPPSNPQMKVLRGVTSESLGGTTEQISSNEINSSRGQSEQRPGQVSAGGDISYELNIRSAVSLLVKLLGTVETTGTGPYVHKATVGQKPKSMTIHKFFSDINTGFTFPGCSPNSFNLSVNPNGVATGSINFLAKSYEITSSELDPTPTEVESDFADGIRMSIEIGGVLFEDLSTFSIEGTNNLQDQRGLGSDKSIGHVPGRFEITGSFALPLSLDKAVPLITKAKTGLEDSLKVTFTIGSESVQFHCPRIKYSGDPVPKAGGNEQVNLELSFTALLDKDNLSPTYNKAIELIINTSEATI